MRKCRVRGHSFSSFKVSCPDIACTFKRHYVNISLIAANMLAAKCLPFVFLVVLLFDIQPTYGKGGRGGGGRGGGSRGSSSGSRGSSSSSSGSRPSSSSGSQGSSSVSQSSSSGRNQWDTSRNNKPSPPKSSIDHPKPVQPSAPELPKPSAPRLPESPGHYQPSNPYPYNPNFPQQGQPGPRVSQGNQPSFGNAPGSNVPQGNPPPYAPQGNPPPYAPQGNPPPYSPQGNPPPYSPQGNPPPYSPRGNPPSYGANPQAPPPYGPNFPSAPSPYGANRPNIPQGNPPPYDVNRGTGSGNVPHGGQPSYSPYPRQPGMVYPPTGGGGSPNSFVLGGSSIKPHKKKGLLGDLVSLGKAKKSKSYGISGPAGSFGAPSFGGQRISPVHMLLPAAAMYKPYKKFSRPKHHFWVLPYAAHHRGGLHLDIDDDDYRGRCFNPRAPVDGSVTCERSLQGLWCKATCKPGYVFSDNTTTLEAQCWRRSGHWSRSKFLPPCKASCEEGCQNGGTCKTPGICQCTSEYRGDHCEHHIMKCDIRTLARGSRISWVCSHSRNETLCTVNCRTPLKFETPPAEKYHCHMNGTWTPNSIPLCIEENQGGGGGIQNLFTTTLPSKEDRSQG